MKKLLLILILLLTPVNVHAVAEDFTTTPWTSGTNDPSSDLTVTSSRLTWTSVVSRNTNVYSIKDFGSGFFTGDFQIDFTYRADSGGTNQFSGPVCIAGVTDTSGDTYEDATDAFCVMQRVVASSQQVIGVTDETASGAIGENISVNTIYYLTGIRSGSNFTVEIYSDSDRMTLVATSDPLTVSTGDFQYGMAFSARTTGSTGRNVSGYIEDWEVTISGGGGDPTPSTKRRTIIMIN